MSDSTPHEKITNSALEIHEIVSKLDEITRLGIKNRVSGIALGLRELTSNVRAAGNKVTIAFEVNTLRSRRVRWEVASVSVKGNIFIAGDAVRLLKIADKLVDEGDPTAVIFSGPRGHVAGFEPRYYHIEVCITKTTAATIVEVYGRGGIVWNGAAVVLEKDSKVVVEIDGDGDVMLWVASQYLPKALMKFLKYAEKALWTIILGKSEVEDNPF